VGLLIREGKEMGGRGEREEEGERVRSGGKDPPLLFDKSNPAHTLRLLLGFASRPPRILHRFTPMVSRLL